MTREELKTLLAAINVEFPRWEISAQKVDLWLKILGKWPYKIGHDAVLEWLGKANQFPPTAGQINELCEKLGLPKALQMSADEAQQERGFLLAQDAADYADRATPKNDRVQYSSEVELQKANLIRQAQWKKFFNYRFEQKKQEALSLIRLGWEPQKAIKKVLAWAGEMEALQEPVKNAVLKITGGKAA